MAFGLFGTRFDIEEFLFGVAVGALIILGFRRLWPLARIGFNWIAGQISAARENLTATTAEPYLQDLIFRLDNHHLANPLFPLQQILVPPRVLSPRPEVDPTQDQQHIDRYQTILPTLPDWNELSSIYRTPSSPLEKVLEIGTNVFISGEIGTGKTTALAYLAFDILIATSQRRLAEQRSVVFIHARSLLETVTEDDESSFDPIVAAVRDGVSKNLSRFVPRYIRNQLRDHETILFIDGFDELPEEQLQPIATWLQKFVEENPQHQIIATGPPRGHDGLLKAGKFLPLSIAPWSNHEREIFLSKWTQAWQNTVLPNLPDEGTVEVDPALLNAWIKVTRRTFDPLETTLLVWSAYVGDLTSPKLTQTLHSYVRRMISPNEQHAAQSIASMMIRERKAFLQEDQIDRRVPLSSLLEARILTRDLNGKVSFANPSVAAYLAAQGFALEEDAPIRWTDDWQPAIAALRYYAPLVDMADPVSKVKEHLSDPLNRALFATAAWLRDAPGSAHWRNHILSPLAVLIQNDSLPYGIRIRALNSIIRAGEKPAQALFQKMLESQSRQTRILGALGLGGIGAVESVPELLSKNIPEEEDEVRLAACMALSVIGSSQALIGLGKWLIDGDDLSQLFAAEALASNHGEGLAMLEDAISMESVRIRRAAVYGLGRIPNDRAEQILQRVEVEDDQAIVRNAATEALEQRRTIPAELSPAPNDLSNLPWLIAYAAEGGLGMTRGKSAIETLRRALLGGSKRQRIAALGAITKFGIQELVLDVLKAMEADDMEVKDAAYEALWHLEAIGVDYAKAYRPTPME